MDREKLIVSNQIGYLILKEDGAVLESGGDLKNDEHSANVIMGLLNLTERWVPEKQRLQGSINNNPFILVSTSRSCRTAAARESPLTTSSTTIASACPIVEYTS